MTPKSRCFGTRARTLHQLKVEVETAIQNIRAQHSVFTRPLDGSRTFPALP
jgi:hypothetical protein